MTAVAKPKTFIDHLKSFGLGILLLAVGVLLTIFVQFPYFSAWSSGGTTWEANDFQATPPEDTIHFLTVKALFGGDSGFYEETRLNGIIPIGTDYFGIILIDNETVLVTKSGEVLPEFEDSRTLTGSLETFDSDVRTQVINDIERELPAGLKVYPRLFDITEAENTWAWIFGGAVCIGIAIAGLVMILRGLAGMFGGNRAAERRI